MKNLLIAIVPLLLVACGKETPKPKPVLANLSFGDKSVAFTADDRVSCTGRGPSSYDGNRGTITATKIEFRKASGEYFSVNLPDIGINYVSPDPFAPRRTDVIAQGTRDSSVAWGGGAEGSYSTGFAAPAVLDPSQHCSLSVTYTTSRVTQLEVTCTGIAGTKADKANMHLTARCD